MPSKKAKGKRKKSRDLMKRKGNSKKITVNKLLKVLNKGAKVKIKIYPGIHSGMPPLCYQGKMAVVKEMRGKCFVVGLKQGSSERKLIVNAAHLVPPN